MVLSTEQYTAVLTIFFHSRFITKIFKSPDQVRDYSSNDKEFNFTMNFNAIEGLGGKERLNSTQIVNILNSGPQTQAESVYFFYLKHINTFTKILSKSKKFLDNRAAGVDSSCLMVRLPDELYSSLTDTLLKIEVDDYLQINRDLEAYRLRNDRSLQLPAPSVSSSSQTLPNILRLEISL
jgi:hypothetical protein